MHVKSPGHHRGHMGSQDFAFLIQALDRIDFFNLHEQYLFKKDGCSEWWTDNPSVSVVVTRGGTEKKVSYYFGCKGLSIGKRLAWLAETIDDVANSAQWVGYGELEK